MTGTTMPIHFTQTPHYADLVARYRAARRAWAASEAVREAARTLGMDERRYSEYFVVRNFPALIWTSDSSRPAIMDTGVWDRAYDEAAP
jgi:hypothetical protein